MQPKYSLLWQDLDPSTVVFYNLRVMYNNYNKFFEIYVFTKKYDAHCEESYLLPNKPTKWPSLLVEFGK